MGAWSVRQTDGVDAPLGELFVHASCTFEAGATGVERARSAREAFLYRRLQTLPDTAGKFRLNVELPIPFDGRGRMEVDLLAAETRVAIELDGPQHLADPEAYRRDRRKDALLRTLARRQRDGPADVPGAPDFCADPVHSAKRSR